MRRLLGKLRSKSGSVLFLVVMIMSLLIIAASATFYIVNNQRSAVAVHYSSEQSYQWATSVGKTVSSYIDGYAKKLRGSSVSAISGEETNILTQMIGLEEGKSFKAELNLIESGLDNDVTVTITKVPRNPGDDEGMHTFAIATTSVVNGETVTVTEYKRLITSDYVPVAEPFTRFLTSTGYRSENCILRATEILSDAFFENEFTLLGNPTRIHSSILVRGSFTDTGLQCPDNGVNIPGLEIVVSQSFNVESASGTGSTNVDKIYVGCDFTTTKSVSANEVYVLGDFTPKQTLLGTGKQLYYVNKDCNLQASTLGCTIYVNGDLYLNVSQNQGKIYVDGDVIINKDPELVQGWVKFTELIYTGEIKYDDGRAVEADRINNLNAKKGTYENPLNAEKIKEVEDHIYEKTGKQNYAVWNAEKYFNTKLNKENNLPTIQPGADGKKDCTIKGSCILKESQAWSDNHSEHLIMIDTDAAGANVFIKLQPLEGRSTFSFMNADSWGSLDIIVKGPYAVVFIIPETVSFVRNVGFIGHADLVYAMANADEKAEIDAHPGATKADKLLQYLVYNNKGERKDTFVHNTIFSNSRIDVLNGLIKTETNESGSYTTFDKSKFHSDSKVHNNIFLVTSGKENSIDFIYEGAFCGYTYAPYTLLKSKGDKSVIALVGGLIAGSYTYWNWTSSLAFLTPYDNNETYKGKTEDYNPAKLVQYLMESSGGTGGSADDEDIVILSNYESLGYK